MEDETSRVVANFYLMLTPIAENATFRSMMDQIKGSE